MNIYISNLDYGVDDAGLKSLFAAYGEVSSAKVITDRDSGRSRGFGFVEMPNEAEAKKAIDELNESQHEGKTITVNVARPKVERTGYSSNRGGYSSSRRY
ncbi:MAG: RNA-binding protein [Prevotellaceae bacterium]|jgi:RNA recognition motif-containing protein|nr:RNA-binding protein [Prevotellaceae bacterium]